MTLPPPTPSPMVFPPSPMVFPPSPGSQPSPRRPGGRRRAVFAAAALASLAGLWSSGPLAQPARAQGTPSLLEFRWDQNRDYRRLYYFISDTERQKRSNYFLILRPSDRNTAILKLTVTIPEHFDSKIDTSRVRLCTMREGGILARTRCLEDIPATIELSENGRALEIFPDTPIADTETIGVNIRLFNPFNAGMYQFNALAQAPGEVPISGYLGSWMIQIDPSGL